MLTFVQHGQALPVAKQGFAPLKFQPESDGITFKVQGDFLAEMPAGTYPRRRKVGTCRGTHQVPRYYRAGNPGRKGNLPRSIRPRHTGGPIWIQEEHPGDDQYRRAVQPGQMVIPQKLAKGKPQSITFPKIENQKAGVKSVKLQATSDSGLPVDYYVVAGPAEVEGGFLKLTPIPTRSKYPLKITVVAYQWGRTIEPLFQSAEPVEQCFVIEKNE